MKSSLISHPLDAALLHRHAPRSLHPPTLVSRTLGVALLLAVFLGGCSIVPQSRLDPTRTYILGVPAAPGATPGPDARAGAQVGIRALTLAGYLQGTKTMLVRHGENELVPQLYARWAEPLDSGLARILRDTLLASGAAAGVDARAGGMSRDADCELSIWILACEGTQNPDGTHGVRFAADYEIRFRASPENTVRRAFAAPSAAWDGKDFSQLAALLSASAEKLATNIASALK
ncbi:MAG: PqiC family protein [Opitutaceae bacterium]|nr:PqiC family protein [Opitutaceae bacterium]